jgi:cobalamin biosynthesis protein CobT
VRVLREILRDKKKEIETRKLLILLATDGAPTDDEGIVQVDELRYVLEHERTPIDHIPVTIIACTGEFYRTKKKYRLH